MTCPCLTKSDYIYSSSLKHFSRDLHEGFDSNFCLYLYGTPDAVKLNLEMFTTAVGGPALDYTFKSFGVLSFSLYSLYFESKQPSGDFRCQPQGALTTPGPI